jgi:hypothetical protein
MSACLNGHLVITKKSLCLDSQFVLLQWSPRVWIVSLFYYNEVLVSG